MKKATVKKALKYETILEIRLNSTTMKRVLGAVRNKVRRHEKFYIVTPNPEIVMRAQSDSELKEIINNADLSLPDGIGLAAASKFLKLPNPKNPLKRFIILGVQGLGIGFSVLFDIKWLTKDFNILKGREVFIELIKMANRNSWKVVLIGDRLQSAQKAKDKLTINYQKVRVTALEGPNLEKNGKPSTKKDAEIERKAISKVNQIKPQLLIVGFGAPKQEKWVNRHFAGLDIGGAMVVGGAFDYISGRDKLPPKWTEEAGLEWLWRLFTGSQKVKRVYRAFPDFPLKVFWTKLNE